MPVTKHMNLEQGATGVVELLALWNTNVNILEAGPTVRLEAGEDMTEYLAFYIKAADGKAWLADATTGIDGIWQSASTSTGTTGLGQYDGIMTNGSWAWTIGATIYVTGSGVLQEAATAVVVGRALSATEIFIDPGGPLGTHTHTETDIVDGSLLARVGDAEVITGAWVHNYAAVFNETGADVDFRIESVGDTDMFSLDAGLNCIGIATTPIAGCRLVLPSENDGTTPTLAFGNGSTGFYEVSSGILGIAVNGTVRFTMDPQAIAGAVAGSFALLNVDATRLVPSICPSRGDTDTGIGHNAGDSLSLIIGAIEGIRLTETSSAIILKQQTTTGITAFATGGQASATQLISSINVIATCASAGDSVKMPAVVVGMKVIVINSGAAACDVFPLSGDDLGAGVDTAVSLAVGAAVEYVGLDTTNWQVM